MIRRTTSALLALGALALAAPAYGADNDGYGETRFNALPTSGMVSKRVPASGAKLGLLTGFGVIALGYFVWPFSEIVNTMHEFYFLGTVFAWLVIMMFVVGELRPRESEWVQVDARAVDLTPWRFSGIAGAVLILIVVLIYIIFADFGPSPYVSQP